MTYEKWKLDGFALWPRSFFWEIANEFSLWNLGQLQSAADKQVTRFCNLLTVARRLGSYKNWKKINKNAFENKNKMNKKVVLHYASFIWKLHQIFCNDIV